MSYERIAVAPISGALGAEIAGVDISRPIDDTTFAEIRRAWVENLVIFFRGQTLTPPQQLAFARRNSWLSPAVLANRWSTRS